MWLTTPVDGGESRGKTIEVNMPDISGGEDLVNMLHELGLFTFAGDRAVGHTFQEVESYSRMTGFNLDAWESSTLVKLSSTAANWWRRAQDKKCENPLGSASEKAETRQQRIENMIFKR